MSTQPDGDPFADAQLFAYTPDAPGEDWLLDDFGPVAEIVAVRAAWAAEHDKAD